MMDSLLLPLKADMSFNEIMFLPAVRPAPPGLPKTWQAMLQLHCSWSRSTPAHHSTAPTNQHPGKRQMEIDSDVIDTLRNYFIETETHDPLMPLSEPAYERFSDLLNQALEANPNDAKLPFWKGWGHQFFRQEKEFEWAENAYEQVLKLNPDFAPAVIALTYLHWQTAHQRAKTIVIEDIKRRYNISPSFSIESLDLDEWTREIEKIPERVRELASFEEAQNTWRKYSTRQFEGVGGKLYDYDVVDPNNGDGEAWLSGDLLVWYRLYAEMSEDLGLNAEQLTRHHNDFAYAFLNEGWSELSPIVKQAFEAVKRYNGKTPSRYLADALAYLAINSSERNEEDPNPQHGFRLLQELLDLYEKNQTDKVIAGTSAIDGFEGFLRDFFALNPVFCSKNPRDCIALFERAQHLGRISSKYPDTVYLYAGRFYGQINQYEKAVMQFEFAEKYLAKNHEYHWDYIEALVELRRSDVAARFLQGLPEGGGQNRVVSIVTKLLLTVRATDDSVEQLVQAFDRRLHQSAKIPTETDIEQRCQGLWPEYWHDFSERLQRAIVTAEYAYEFMQNGKQWDYSMIGAQWGKAAEIAFEYSFVLPFSQYVDRHHISEVETFPSGKNRPENSKRLIGPDLSAENLLKRKQIERTGLLWAAAADRRHPVIEMLTELKLDVNLWTSSVPTLLALVNRLRNRFVHPESLSTLEDVQELRSILVTKGLLADMGQAMVNQRFLK